jgi:uncharacterized phage infection (PIP) family protein YhgE
MPDIHTSISQAAALATDLDSAASVIQRQWHLINDGLPDAAENLADIAQQAVSLLDNTQFQAALRLGAWLLCQFGLDEADKVEAGDIEHAIELLGNSSIPDAIETLKDSIR